MHRPPKGRSVQTLPPREGTARSNNVFGLRQFRQSTVMVGLERQQALLLSEIFLADVALEPPCRLRQRCLKLRSLRHHPNGLLQIARKAIRVSGHLVRGECERVGPEHPFSHIIHFTCPQYGKEALCFNSFFA